MALAAREVKLWPRTMEGGEKREDGWMKSDRKKYRQLLEMFGYREGFGVVWSGWD